MNFVCLLFQLLGILLSYIYINRIEDEIDQIKTAPYGTWGGGDDTDAPAEKDTAV